MDEVLKIDANSKVVAGAVTDDANQYIRNMRIDDTTKGLKVQIVGGGGTGTVTSITASTGLTATPNPIVGIGTIALDSKLAPLDTLGTANQQIRVNAGATALEYFTASAGPDNITVGTTTITSGTTTRILYDNAGVVGEYTLSGSGTVVAMATAPTFSTSITGSYLDASEILITDGSKNIVSAAVATYPSLTELAFVKGVTSAIQTQINSKGAGTVTTVSVATANGFSGTVANATTTPAITIIAGAITPTSTNGVSAATMAFMDATSSVQTQLNAKGSGTVTAVSIATANGFSGSSSGGATPALTIVAGAITPTTVNGNTFTTGTYTLTGTAGKTLTFTNSITLTGTDAQTYTFPTTTATIARTDAGQTFTGVNTFTSPATTTSITTGSASFTAWAGATTLLTFGGTGASASTFMPSTLDASSSITGAIRTSGGISAAKQLWVGTSLNVGTTSTLTGVVTTGSDIELGNASDTTLHRVSAGLVSIEGSNILTAGAAQVVTGQNKFNNIIDVNNAITASSNAATVPITFRLNTVTNNSAATLTITMTTASAVDGQMTIVRILDASAAAQTLAWTNTENSTVTAPVLTNGSTTLFLTVGFIYNSGTSKWRCIASA